VENLEEMNKFLDIYAHTKSNQKAVILLHRPILNNELETTTGYHKNKSFFGFTDDF
jgi:hypothetical protein